MNETKLSTNQSPAKREGIIAVIPQADPNAELQDYYFTFGTGHELAQFYQVIKAPNEYEAYQAMFKAHGKKWAFGYNSEDWKKMKEEGRFYNFDELVTITVTEGGGRNDVWRNGAVDKQVE